MKKVLAVVFLAAMALPSGNASMAYPPAQILPFYSLTPSSSQVLVFQTFDPSVYSIPGFNAVLTSVEAEITANSTGTLNVVNLSGLYVPQNFDFVNAGTMIPVQVTSVGGLTFGLNAVVNRCGSVATPNPNPAPGCTNSGSGTLLDPYGISGTAYPIFTTGLANSGSTNQWTGLWGTASQGAFLDPRRYSSYVGSSADTITVRITAGGAASYGTDLSAQYLTFGGTATTNGYVTLTYGYDLVEVPEPAGCSLVGLALVFCTRFVRRGQWSSARHSSRTANPTLSGRDGSL